MSNLKIKEGAPQQQCRWLVTVLAWLLQAFAAAAILLCVLAWGQRTQPTALCHLQPGGQRCMLNTLLRLEDVQWSTTNGSSDQLKVSGCSLKRYSAAEARRCLAGKRLVMLGDSVTRFQYVVLAYFLHKGSWPQPVGDQPEHPSVANNKAWHSVSAYTTGTNALFEGNELCDCTGHTDNRHYLDDEFSVHYLRFSDGKATGWATGNMSGHYGFPPYLHRPMPNATTPHTADTDWTFELTEALAGPVAQLKPTHLIINSGLHASTNFWPGEHAQTIALAGQSAVSGQHGRVFWKTTTAAKPSTVARSSRDHDATALEAARRFGWGVYDTYALTRPLLDLPQPPLWDTVHFEAGVYRELNLFLLNIICSE